MSNPAISVVMPVYNRAGLVGESITSVLSQSITEWEMIVVDDHSSDSTVERVNRYAAEDPRIRPFIRKSEHKGGSVCRNEGVSYAKSDLVVFLDSDDLLAEGCLENRIRFMQENDSDQDFAVFQTEVFREIPGDMGVCFNRLESGVDDIVRFLVYDAPWITVGMVWKRDALLQLGGWNESLLCHQDWELSLRALFAGLKYKKTDKIDAYFRMENDKRKTVSGTSHSPDLIANSMLGYEHVYKTLCTHPEANKHMPLLRCSAYKRLFGICDQHRRGLYCRTALQMHRCGIFKASDLFCIFAVAGLSSVANRLSRLVDRLVWRRHFTRSDIIRERWQYKWPAGKR